MALVTVVGAGAWGTALAKVLADKGNPTVLYSHREEHAQAINSDRENKRYLPNAKLPDTLRATADMRTALRGADLIVFVVPSHAFRDTLKEARAHIPQDALLCSATKGIENESLMLMSEIFLDELGWMNEARLTYLSGPSFAKEVAAQQPTAIVIAGSSAKATEIVQQHFATDRLRVYTSPDVVGVEVGGALKNVIAIASGAADGLGFGHNARAGLITRGLAEIGRIAAFKGANPLTLAGLAGMGDLVLTCTGDLSRNRTVGYELGKGRTLDDVLSTLGHVAEGVKTTKSAHDLAVNLGVELPITSEVYQVLYEGKPAQKAVIDLMTRALRRE